MRRRSLQHVDYWGIPRSFETGFLTAEDTGNGHLCLGIYHGIPRTIGDNMMKIDEASRLIVVVWNMKQS